jgi:heterodisulfide reductase subunit C
MLFENLHIRIQKFYCRKCGTCTLVCAIACDVVQYWGTSFIAAVVVPGDWEIFHSEVLGDSCSSADVIMVIKSHAGPVACMGEKM